MPIIRRISEEQLDHEAFAQTLQQLREAQGLTKAEFGKRVGVSSNTVWAWETCYSRPQSRRLPTIASALGVSESYLRTGVEPDETSDTEEVTIDDIDAMVDALRQKISSTTGMPSDRVKVHVEFVF